MLFIERQVRSVYADCLCAEMKMPRKGQKLYISSPYHPKGLCVEWYPAVSPDGKRLFKVGPVEMPKGL